LKGLFQKEALYPPQDILPESGLPFSQLEGWKRDYSSRQTLLGQSGQD
jgi:hypothetical protein